ncbi:aspartyl-phosphate phosphatase Spo0E family protein [Clostridium thermarum]
MKQFKTVQSDPEIVRKSQELDQLIVQAMRGGE